MTLFPLLLFSHQWQTLDEIRDALANRGMRVSLATVWRFCGRHRITREKIPPRDRAGAT
jgi:uncharacterized protein with HEPN domain